MKRFFTRLAGSIVVAFLILVLGLTWLYQTATGAKFLIETARPYLPSSLSLGKVGGTLSQGLLVDKLSWSDPKYTIELSDLKVRCEWLNLLFDQLYCSSFDMNTLVVRYQQTSTNNDSFDLSQIETPSDIKLPLSVRLDRLSINMTRIERSTSPTANDEYSQIFRADNLEATQTSWKNNKLAVEQLRFDHGSSRLTFNIALTPQNQWPILTKLKLTDAKRSLQFMFEGELFEKAIVHSQYASSVNSKFKANYDFNNGKPLLDGIVAIEPADLSSYVTNLKLHSFQSKVSLAWPRISLMSNGRFAYGNDELLLEQALTIDSILDWRKKLKSKLRLKGDLTETLHNQMLTKNMEGQKGDRTKEAISWPVDAAFLVDIDDYQLTFSSEDLTLNNIDAEINASADLTVLPFQQLRSSGSVRLAKAPKWLGIDITNLNSRFSLKQESWQKPLIVSFDGQADLVSTDRFSAKNLEWTISKDRELDASLYFHQLDLYLLDKPLQFENSQIQFAGLQRHKIKMKTDIGKSSIDADIVGVIDFGSQGHSPTWYSELATAKLIHQSEYIDVRVSDLKVSKNRIHVAACLSGVGQVCSDVTHSDLDWQADIQLNEFRISDISTWLRAVEYPVPINVNGLVSGGLSLGGSGTSLSQLNAKLSAPVFSASYDKASAVLSELVLDTQKVNDTYIINVNWQHAGQQIDLPQTAMIAASQRGMVKAVISSLNHFEFDFSQPNTIVTFTNPRSEERIETSFEVPISRSQITMRFNSGEFEIAGVAEVFEQDYFKADLASSWPLQDESSINGSVSFSFSHFDWLKQLQTRMDQVDMSWQHQSTIAGTIKNPDFIGKGKLNIKQLTVEELGVDVQNSELNIASKNTVFDLQGHLENQQGNLDFEGQISLLPRLTAKAKLRGNKLSLIETDKQKIVVSPSIDVNYQNQYLEVTGDILFDELKVALSKIPNSKIRVSDDQIVLAEPTRPKQSFLYKIKLNLGINDVASFSGLGFSSKINGDLKLLAESGQAINIEGQLLLDSGQFEAFKQVLEIEQGQLVFLGPADNPGIQFTATRNIDDIKVGVKADGSLLNPILTLYSEPAMPEENIVALLLTGRSIDSLSANEGNALANAAISLGIDGANRIAQKIGEAIGIKNIQFTTKNTSDASRVNVETQVNDKLSVGYGTTINSQNQTQTGWIIEYRLSPKLSFEAITGEEISTNLTYKTQFDEKEENKDSK